MNVSRGMASIDAVAAADARVAVVALVTLMNTVAFVNGGDPGPRVAPPRSRGHAGLTAFRTWLLDEARAYTDAQT